MRNPGCSSQHDIMSQVIIETHNERESEIVSVCVGERERKKERKSTVVAPNIMSIIIIKHTHTNGEKREKESVCMKY